MTLIRRRPWLSAGLIVLLVCTLAAAFMVGGPVKKIQAKAAAALNPLVALKPQGNGYTYRRTITLDHTKVPNTDQSNFPVLISGSYSYLATVPNGGSVQNVNGYDVIFTSDSTCSTPLNHDVEAYTTSGVVNYWVKVPAISHTSDTVIYMCYGNSSVTTNQSNPMGVWDSNFKAVYHLRDGTTLSGADSTANGNTGTKGASATAASARIGGGMSLTGTTGGNEHVSVASNAGLRASTITVSAWVKTTDASGNRHAVTEDNNSTRNWTLRQTATQFQFTTFDAFLNQTTAGSTTNFSLNTWHYLVGVFDGVTGKAKLYVDGSNTVTTQAPVALNTGTVDLHIGQKSDGSSVWKGTLDEVRYSNIVRSADWIATEYNNQNSPSTFYSISPVSTTFTHKRRITIDHAKIPNTDQSNFPVLISGTYPDLAAVANGGSVQSSNGYDVIFTSDCNCSSQLNHEVETYNATTGAVNYWVKVPELSHTTDTVIYMCYGNAAIDSSQQNAAGVWDANFKAVWHVPNGSVLNLDDSTTNHNLTNKDATATTGKVDGGVSFDGNAQYVGSAQHADFSWANLRAVEFWMKLGNTTQVLPRLFSNSDGGSDGWSITWIDPPSVAASGLAGKFLTVSIGTQATPSIQRQTPDNGTINTAGVWHHVAVIGDGTTVAAIYLDGSPVTVSNYTGNITNTTTTGLNIGRRNNGARYFNGALDELRLSNAQRSADWIKTEYNNQSSPATFYSISAANDGCNEPPVANAGGPYSAESSNSIKFDGSGSSDPESILSSYQWDFGDGNTCTEELCSYAYVTPGTYTVTLTVTDGSGATASAITTATVTGLLANPGGPYSGVKQTPIQFQGDASTGSITSYQWNFGDGHEASGVSPTHSYASSGIYSVSLTVTDNERGTSTAYTTATINTAPIAFGGGPYSGLSGSAVQLNGAGSIDSDGTIASYQWNFGDGTSGVGQTPIHVYSSIGTYSPQLTVTDDLGATATANTSVVITSPSNQLPVANPQGPYSAQIGTPVQFNGSGSYDPDGSIAVYHWEFADGGTAEGVAPTHSFTGSGTHIVTLKVTDNGGATSWTSLNIKVAGSGSGGGGSPLNILDVSWDPGNRDSLDDPGNDRGNQANHVGGNNNFQITAPVLSLPGRGVDLNLSLIYNSLVWNKAGNEMAFDIDQDWPAPGWQLGFGKMVAMGSAGALLIEPDGTRHSLTGTVFDDVRPPPFPGVVPTFKGRTTDGSLIEYRCEGLNGAGQPEGMARYPDGTVVHYRNYSTDFTVPRTYLYPYQIINANGNIITITYLWDLREPRLQRIIDSVGRVITFHYDSQKRLTSVTAPGLPEPNGSPTTQTFIRLHYATKTLGISGAFNGMNLRVRNASPAVIDAIYYPSTGMGYWLPADDAYSAYGMLKKVAEHRGMGFSPAANPDEQGTITAGTVTRQQEYNYPSAPANLSAAPTFNNATETWDGANAPNSTSFAVQDDSTAHERTITVTNPDQTKSVQIAFNFGNPPPSDPNKFRDGLMKEQRLLAADNHLMSKTVFFWEKGIDDAARLQRVETTDEPGNTSASDYDQYGSNNSLGRTRERDFDGSIIRTTVNTYVSYLDSDIDLRLGFEFHNIFHPRRVNLVDSVSIFDGDDTANKLAARTEFRYDVYPVPLRAYAADGNNNINLNFNGETVGPITGILRHSVYFSPLPPGLDGGAGEDNYFTKRGNITSVTSYADTTNPAQPANPITETRTYDMAGNVIAASVACCEETSSAFILQTQYAFPDSQTRGSADPNSLDRVTASAKYDLNTGLKLSMKDENGLTTLTNYYPQNLQPKEIVFATGARATIEYDALAMKVTQTTSVSLTGPIAIKTTKYLNGLGQVRREESVGANGIVDIVETVYDDFGRLSKQSLPYRTGDSPEWKQTIYDAAGRVLESFEPPVPTGTSGAPGANEPATKYFYNESTRPAGASNEPGQTTRTVDAWDRWRWARLDSEGRVVELLEPNPSGAAGFRTRYSYNTLGKLVQVSQGEPVQQVRRFRYDSLGRLTHQKLAEASATLNASGQWDEAGDPNDKWSDVFSYDQRSNLVSHVDARGVKTNFKYTDSSNHDDPLNRLQSVSFDLAGVPSSLTVLPSATVNYHYRTKNSPSDLVDVTQSKQVEILNVGTEEYDYDAQGRTVEKRFSFAGRSLPMTTTYAYDNLDRLDHTTYPEQYHDNVQNPSRKVVTPIYDPASRITDLRVNNVNYASQILYNAASQITSLVVGNGSNQVNENYSYELATGLLSNQEVKRGATTLLSLHYEYRQSYCEGSGLCTALPASYFPTGQLTRVTNAVTGKSQHFSYDSIGRLKKADQGSWTQGIPFLEFVTDWTQNYSYDPFGNRTGVTATNTSGVTPVPQDGSSSLSFDSATNRITSSGYVYDPAGNQLQNNSGQLFVYDAAGRLAQVKNLTNGTVLATYTYGTSNHRLITQTGSQTSTDKTYYLWEGDSVVAEYVEQTSATMPKWAKNYIYIGGRLLATEEPSGGGEIVRYHHPDRLGTRLVTNNLDTTSFQQSNLPFGTALDAESTSTTNRRFTSYDRSATTGLDYAVNRHYDSRQGRFTQPDSLGMGAASLADPQSLNMYSYVGNDPMNRVDPNGQFWGALFQFIGGLFRGLKPNIINGSFAYHDHPPISVSFTTNFQNIGVGYGRLGFGIRGTWVPSLLGSGIDLGGEHLSDCLRDILRPFYPTQTVWGRDLSPIDEIQFFAGVPSPYNKNPNPEERVEAVTLGIDVHYDSNFITIKGGSGHSLTTIIEELSHVEQFLKIWAGMPGRIRFKSARGPANMGGIQQLPLTLPYTISPTYGQAKTFWKGVYAAAVIHAKVSGHKGYDNTIEWEAQNKVAMIAQHLTLYAQVMHKDNICGFRLDFTTTYRAKY